MENECFVVKITLVILSLKDVIKRIKSLALKTKFLIVEDQFIEAKSLNVILTNAGYSTCSIARSVAMALSIIEKEKPDLVLVDIFLQGEGYRY